MSKFKKMKLVPFDEEPQSKLESNLENIVTFETSTPVKQLSDLDNEIGSILNSKLDLDTKSKLYSDSLRKFLNVKRKYTQSDKKNKTPICVDIDSSDRPIQTNNKPVKRKRLTKKLGNKSPNTISSHVKTPKIDQYLIKKKKPAIKSNKILSKNYLLKPSQIKNFIESQANNNGPSWIEY